MLGEFSCLDLTAFFEVLPLPSSPSAATLTTTHQIFILNRSRLSNGTTLTSSLSGALTNLAHRTNTLANSRLNIQAHYDISNDMFAAFLSPDMTYSCPIWAPAPTTPQKNPPKPESLEHAQQTKLAYFISQARIKRSDHVLEIGTGWGSFAIAAVRATGCRVTSITLSIEQKELAEQRIADAGFTDNIEVLLCDYRALPTPKEGLYDKIVSIEMLEAVGAEFLNTYFQCVHKLLKPDGGLAVFQCITIPETVRPPHSLSHKSTTNPPPPQRYAAYQKSTDFIRRYIFPGGHLPTVSQLVSSIAAGSSGALIVDNIRNIGPHYSRTLRAWCDNFNASWDARIRPALLRDHAGMTDADAELFRRKWEYYFCYCEAGFRTCTLGDVIITVGREGAMELAQGVEL